VTDKTELDVENLRVLREVVAGTDHWAKVVSLDRAIAALRAQPSEPQGKPFAWFYDESSPGDLDALEYTRDRRTAMRATENGCMVIPVFTNPAGGANVVYSGDLPGHKVMPGFITPERMADLHRAIGRTASPAEGRMVFQCKRCPVSVESAWQPPDCPECGDPCELDATAKPTPADSPATLGEESEDDYVIRQLSGLLAEIAVIVNGPEPPMTRWSYHDLPVKVRELKESKE
jgi:hypothetical protein